MPKGQIVFKNGDYFEGEVKHDLPNGKGLYKFKNGSFYDGEFIDGKFNGYGKLVDTFNELTIIGNFLDGLSSGRSKIQYNDGSKYEGQTKNGLRFGKGILNFSSSNLQKMYKGWFSEDEMNGQGELIFKNGDIYRGKFQSNHLNGQGQILTQEYSYVGQIRKGMIEGKGSLKYSSGDLYQGEFQVNQKHGFGKYTYSDGTVYQGNWFQDEKKGKGKIVYRNGDWFQGTFDEENQQGGLSWGEWKIQGELKNEELNGAAVLRKGDTQMRANYKQGIQSGRISIQKKIKGQAITYNGQFDKGHEKGYSVRYSKRI